MKCLFVWIFLSLSIVGCIPGTMPYQRLGGETMGTQFNVTFKENGTTGVLDSIEKVLAGINAEVNTYDPQSVISRFNRSTDLDISGVEKHFIANFAMAESVYQKSDGYFDPTIMPLVNYWGFGTTSKEAVTKVDSTIIDSIRQFVGFPKVHLDLKSKKIYKDDPRVQLDFSAVAKGYAVDQIGSFLTSKGIKDYLVEIGGEVVTSGKNQKGDKWSVGISTPLPNTEMTDFIDVVAISGQGMASSGNYRNYRELNGQVYGHTINPLIGYPSKNSLLGVTIIANSCMLADACATASMAMGLPEAKDFISKFDSIYAAFYYMGRDGSIKTNYTNGFIQYNKGSG